MSEKLITPERLGQIAKNILDLLEKEKINSIENLEEKLGESFDIEGGDIIIDSKLEDHIIIYIDYNVGVPVEIRMNPVLNYSRIIVKTNSRLKDYAPSIRDSFGNIIQDKKIKSCSIPEIKKELEKLAS